MTQVIANPTTRQWLELANKSGFRLVAANGWDARNRTSKGLRHTWNDIRSVGDGRRSKLDDVGFLESVVEWCAKEHGIDRSRVYATGASNGGMMVLRLMVERPRILAAGVPFIASMAAGEGSSRTSTTPLSCPEFGDQNAPFGPRTSALSRAREAGSRDSSRRCLGPR